MLMVTSAEASTMLLLCRPTYSFLCGLDSNACQMYCAADAGSPAVLLCQMSTTTAPMQHELPQSIRCRNNHASTVLARAVNSCGKGSCRSTESTAHTTIVPLKRNATASVQLQDPTSNIVQEVPGGRQAGEQQPPPGRRCWWECITAL